MEPNKRKINESRSKLKKRKPPEVRQTLTSKLRILRANPLLMLELSQKISIDNSENENKLVMKPLKTLITALDNETKVKHEIKNRCSSQGLSPFTEPSQEKIRTEANVSRRKSLYVKTLRNKNTSQHNAYAQNSKQVTSKLNVWLKRHGKSFSEYQHLKCFGMHLQKEQITEDKENIETNTMKQNSYNDFKSKSVTNEENINNNDNDSAEIAQEALKDLLKLILEDYPVDQCEIWLKLIKQKCKQVTNVSEYWECRAALEETKGNVNMAVQCYQSAIVHGARVECVDKYLDQLLQKFSLLNIQNLNADVNNGRRKVIQDARNIFKSTIIQFAVQERVFKMKSETGMSIEKKLIVTPVRRSTRLSRSKFTSTPGVHVYSSLQEVDSSLRNVLHFQSNNALSD